MGGFGRHRKTWLLFSAGCLALAPAPAGTADLWSQVSVQDPGTVKALRRALAGAARRLSGERCRAVLSDFRDQRGRPLHARLSELGVGADGYLHRLSFREGWGTGECANNDRLAFTRTGGDVVWVCGAKFEHAANTNAGWAEATIIHEALHTLGLGEAGASSSLAITRRVLARCGH